MEKTETRETAPKAGNNKTLLTLILTFLKIGAFTFGGGYAMIALLENEFVSKRKWMTHNEFLDMTAIAESTPGPIAVNSATYIGYQQQGIAGALLSTLAVCLPSFAIIFVISLFMEQFLSLLPVQYAFAGIRVCVIWLIAGAGIRMLKKMKKDIFSRIVFGISFLSIVFVSLSDLSFSSIWLILISGSAGLLVCRIRDLHMEGEKN